MDAHERWRPHPHRSGGLVDGSFAEPFGARPMLEFVGDVASLHGKGGKNHRDVVLTPAQRLRGKGGDSPEAVFLLATDAARKDRPRLVVAHRLAVAVETDEGQAP